MRLRLRRRLPARTGAAQVDVGVAGAVRVPALGAAALLEVMDLFSATLLTVRVGILGPLEVRDDAGALLPVGGTRLRALLIRLAIADGRAISVERLAEELWDGQFPADAANAVQALVSRLRGVVGRDTVEFGPAGYRLAVDQDAVDARVFEQQVDAGRRALADGRWAEAASLLAEALGQWRGPALADVADAPFA